MELSDEVRNRITVKLHVICKCGSLGQHVRLLAEW